MITHRHHIVPRHIGGDDSPENLVELSLEEHAEAHRLLYEQHGRLEDKLAWLGLSGQIPIADLQHQILRRPKSAEHRRKLSEALKGKNFHSDEYRERLRQEQTGAKNRFYGKTHTPETKALIKAKRASQPPISAEGRKKISNAHKGKPLSAERKRNISLAKKGKGQPWSAVRWEKHYKKWGTKKNDKKSGR